MLPDKFDQIVDAIVDGKYSWACVLLLRSNGLNPLHYIPYRTYNRLQKENMQSKRQPILPSEKIAQAFLSSSISHLYKKQEQRATTIDDLSHIETAAQAKVQGGAQPYYSIYVDRALALSR
jgi:hypothetical protein